MNETRKLYLAHPYDGKDQNLQKVKQLRQFYEQHYGTVLSPVEKFKDEYEELDYLDGMSLCFRLMDEADEVAFPRNFMKSKGCCMEYGYAKANGIPIRFYDELDIGESNDTINNPSHYNAHDIEVIDFIEDWEFDFRLANAIKYISRCRYKGTMKQDLEKAIWYIKRYILKNCKK